MRMPRRLLPLLLSVALAMAGLALGAQLQVENALPSSAVSQNEGNQRAATGNAIVLSGILVALGVTFAFWSLASKPARPLWRSRLLPLASAFAGAYIVVNLAQTAFPFYVAFTSDTMRQGTFSVNLFASNAHALPSVLVPIFAIWAGALLLLLWGARQLVRPSGPRIPDAGRLLARQTGTLLVAAPFLGLACWGCLRLMVALPPVPGATPYRVILSLAALAFLGLLLAGAGKAWQLMRAARDPRLSPLSLEAWEGIGRAEIGLACVLGLLAITVLAMPSFPPEAPHCLPIDPASRVPCPRTDPNVQYHDELVDVSELLQLGYTFGTPLHVHLILLLTALVPMVPMRRIHRQCVRLLEGDREWDPVRVNAAGTRTDARPAAGTVPRGWTVTFAASLGLSLVLGGLATWLAPGALWAWLGATLPILVALRSLAEPVRQAQGTLLAAFATWCLGNSLAADYDAASGPLHFASSPGVSELWLLRLLGAILCAWALAGLVRAAARDERPSTAIPLAAGTAVAILAVVLLELPLDMWTDTITVQGQVEGVSVYVGTAVARLAFAASVAVHVLCLVLAGAAAAMTARLVRPDWFRRGREPLPAPRPVVPTA